MQSRTNVHAKVANAELRQLALGGWHFRLVAKRWKGCVAKFVVAKSDHKSGGVSACMYIGQMKSVKVCCLSSFPLVILFTRLGSPVGCHGSGASRPRAAASSRLWTEWRVVVPQESSSCNRLATYSGESEYFWTYIESSTTHYTPITCQGLIILRHSKLITVQFGDSQVEVEFSSEGRVNCKMFSSL